MKNKYILTTFKETDDIDCYKIWLPLNYSTIFYLNDNGIIWSIKGVNNINCDVIYDVSTHEKVFEFKELNASNPLELIMKLDLYPNLYLEI